MRDIAIPSQLDASCTTPERQVWLRQLPQIIQSFLRRWHLTLAPALTGIEGSCSWVSQVILSDGSRAVLKVGMPHMEAEHEIEGLRFWNGNGTVRLFQADDETGAMLIELCEPGTTLRERLELEQDEVIARLLRRLWQAPSAPIPFAHSRR